jgi:hypothetical protein
MKHSETLMLAVGWSTNLINYDIVQPGRFKPTGRTTMATAKKTAKTQKTKAPKIVAALEQGLKAIQDQAPVTETSKAEKKTAASKTKRVSLNPQPIIDAKTAALKELGVKLTYKGRQWIAGDRSFTSLEFSKYSIEQFAKLFAK